MMGFLYKCQGGVLFEKDDCLNRKGPWKETEETIDLLFIYRAFPPPPLVVYL